MVAHSHPPPLAPSLVKEFICEASIDALNLAIVDLAIQPAAIIQVLYIEAKLQSSAKYHVLYRS
jgi:hypothetical protein